MMRPWLVGEALTEVGGPASSRLRTISLLAIALASLGCNEPPAVEVEPLPSEPVAEPEPVPEPEPEPEPEPVVEVEPTEEEPPAMRRRPGVRSGMTSDWTQGQVDLDAVFDPPSSGAGMHQSQRRR